MAEKHSSSPVWPHMMSRIKEPTLADAPKMEGGNLVGEAFSFDVATGKVHAQTAALLPRLCKFFSSLDRHSSIEPKKKDRCMLTFRGSLHGLAGLRYNQAEDTFGVPHLLPLFFLSFCFCLLPSLFLRAQYTGYFVPQSA